MPRRNRVDPWGVPHAVEGRGTLMGNRGGRVHDPTGEIVRAQSSRQWICCVLAFRDRARTVMGDGYTELFFLDEATALAAGHRPCFECRREDAARFLALHRRVSGEATARADDLDRALARERRLPRTGVGDGKLAVRATVATLPTGAMVDRHDTAWLVVRGADVPPGLGVGAPGTEPVVLLPWSPVGYDPGARHVVADDDLGWLLTPPTTTRILSAGYRPTVHHTAGLAP